MKQHTPGPWHFNDDFTIEGRYSVNAIGYFNGFTNPRVAEILTDFCIDSDAQANARLIAVAPNLLKALERIAEAKGDGSIPLTKADAQGFVVIAQQTIQKLNP